MMGMKIKETLYFQQHSSKNIIHHKICYLLILCRVIKSNEQKITGENTHASQGNSASSRHYIS